MNFRLIISAFFSLLVFSCAKENLGDCFKGRGKNKNQVRHPGEFRSIQALSKLEVFLIQGPEYKVEINTGENLLSNIHTTVSNGQLVLENRNTCNFVRGYKHPIRIWITAPHIDKIDNSGVGPFTIDPGFMQDSIFIRAESSGDIFVNGTYRILRTSSHGNGDIYINATCRMLFVFMYGTNFLYGEGLNVDSYAFIYNQSLGDCTINARNLQSLDYNIQSDGNIYYIGKPGKISNYGVEEVRGRAIERD